MAEVRAMIPRRPGFSRPSSAIISSVSPSLKNSCSASGLTFANGSTARWIREAEAAADEVPTPPNRREEPVAAPRHGGDKARIRGRVSERLAKPVDGLVQPVLEIHVGATGPEAGQRA